MDYKTLVEMLLEALKPFALAGDDTDVLEALPQENLLLEDRRAYVYIYIDDTEDGVTPLTVAHLRDAKHVYDLVKRGMK